MKNPIKNNLIIELHVPDFSVVKDFYSKLGFEVNYTEDNDGNINPNSPDSWYLGYDLKKELPKKEIIRLQ